MCDRGRTITHMHIPRFHTQVWYNAFELKNGKFDTTMIYPCFSRSFCFSMGSPSWWRFGICLCGSSLVFWWRPSPFRLFDRAIFITWLNPVTACELQMTWDTGISMDMPGLFTPDIACKGGFNNTDIFSRAREIAVETRSFYSYKAFSTMS